MPEIPVEIWPMVRDEEGHDVLLLRDARGRLLPIPIGICEAAAIWVRQRPELSTPYLRRPWSHDLLIALLEWAGATLDRVVVDDYTNGTFYATLYLTYQGRELIVDARPSDGIALGLRTGAPVAVSDDVMFRAAVLQDGPGFDGGDWETDDDFPAV